MLTTSKKRLFQGVVYAYITFPSGDVRLRHVPVKLIGASKFRVFRTEWAACARMLWLYGGSR